MSMKTFFYNLNFNSSSARKILQVDFNVDCLKCALFFLFPCFSTPWIWRLLSDSNQATVWNREISYYLDFHNVGVHN